MRRSSSAPRPAAGAHRLQRRQRRGVRACDADQPDGGQHHRHTERAQQHDEDQCGATRRGVERCDGGRGTGHARRSSQVRCADGIVLPPTPWSHERGGSAASGHTRGRHVERAVDRRRRGRCASACCTSPIASSRTGWPRTASASSRRPSPSTASATSPAAGGRCAACCSRTAALMLSQRSHPQEGQQRVADRGQVAAAAGAAGSSTSCSRCRPRPTGRCSCCACRPRASWCRSSIGWRRRAGGQRSET